MKKIFTWWRQESSSSGSSTSIERSRVGDRELGYHIRRKDLGKIHKAATEGNIEKIKQILLPRRNDVNYRDKKNRTALHLACACGHPAVVSLLADSKCLLDLCDRDNRTPLIKAVQCQQEECVAALLDRGADPNIRDIDGNSALHHAVLGESVAILAKLLLSNVNMEVRNKDDLTPLALAESEQKRQMMALLVKKGTEFEKTKRMKRLTSNDKGFKIEEERKKQKVSKMKVTKEIHQAAGEDGHGLIKPRDCKQTDNQPFPLMENDNSDRTSEEICYEEYKVKENINSIDDLDDLTQPTETVSEPFSNCKNFMLLIEELCKNCKDPCSLYKIQHAILSLDRSMEHGGNKCALLTKEVKIMEKSVRKLQRELSETREIKSELEHQQAKLEEELSNLRLTLQEEKKKRQKADLLSEKTKKQLIKKEEEFIKETEKNRELETTVETLELKLKTLLENSDRNDYLRDKLKAMSSSCPYLEEENKLLHQELLSMKKMETQCKMLEDENKKLKEKVVNLRRHMETNMAEQSELEHYKQAEERARQDAAEHLQQVKSLMQIHRESQEHNFSVQSHLELRNKELESELLKMQSSLHFNNTKMENYVALYQEESEKRRLLENELNETINKMVQVHAELFQLKEKYWDLLSTIQTRPVLQAPCAVNTNSNSNTSFMPSTQRNPSTLIFPTMEEMKNDYLRDKLKAMSSSCPYLEEENKLLHQELLSMKKMETQCKMLEDENKKLKEKVVNLRRHMETNMAEQSELEHYKQAEERARQDAAEHLQQVKSLMQIHRESQEHNFSVQSHLELRNKELESELLKMQSSLHFNNTKMENYVALYQEESEKRRLLENELNETIKKMVQVRAELFQLKEKNRNLLSTIQMRPVLQTPCAVNTNSNTYTSFMPCTQRTPRKRAAFPTIEEMKKEFDKKVEEALKDEAAKFVYECHTAHPGRSSDLSKSSHELCLEANQEYTECLMKRYMRWLI